MNTTHTSGQLAKFLELLEEKGVTPETFQQRLGSGVLSDIFDTSAVFPERDKWRKLFGLGLLVPKLIILTVDYGQTLEEMISTGNYYWKNDDLTAKRFPIKGKGVQEFETCLIHPNRSISFDDCIQLIKDTDKANPWEPAQTEHLLAFGAKYPEEQQKFPIVALGSVGEVDGRRRMPSTIVARGAVSTSLGSTLTGVSAIASLRFAKRSLANSILVPSPRALEPWTLCPAFRTLLRSHDCGRVLFVF